MIAHTRGLGGEPSARVYLPLQKAAAPWNTTNGKFNRFSQTAMVTPGISGLRNKDALQVPSCREPLLRTFVPLLGALAAPAALASDLPCCM